MWAWIQSLHSSHSLSYFIPYSSSFELFRTLNSCLWAVLCNGVPFTTLFQPVNLMCLSFSSLKFNIWASDFRSLTLSVLRRLLFDPSSPSPCIPPGPIHGGGGSGPQPFKIHNIFFYLASELSRQLENKT